ncbi:MAG: hypothetical protein A2057_04445 [Ignavibacteria bacterium GWA2_35_9]|nr:MAG: hypothetical protein A2057_04445 [Ignavibacteria bacterium GWA2_35_9]OGU46023.1 MAG: hypothetical protein A2000_05245 [Ignavibacteria bacterium GWB2_36_8]OGU48329.1 MAG: hypothetical protein A2080_14465 [Ignavibacteria bacterium GWC2_36_12]
MKLIIKYTSTIIFTFLISNSCTYAQYRPTSENSGVNISKLDELGSTIQNDTISETKPESNTRKFYFSFNTGFLEILGIGFGYQYSNEWNFTTKVSLESREQLVFSLSGLGIRAARFFSTSLPFNNINVQPTVMLLTRKGLSYHFGLNGFSFEIGIGNESIKKSQIDFFWSLGGIISTVKKDKPLYSPSLKLGLNWNF